MNKPALPIEVDVNTGVWQTDGLPMLYVPRHFFVNNHDAIEQKLGKEAYAKILHQAGYKSAQQWCTHESEQHGLSGMDVFRHYLKRLSLRGWGIFSFVADDLSNPPLVIQLDYSAFVLHARRFPEPDKKGKFLCHMFAGWFAGAADWVAKQQGEVGGFDCRETRCAFVEGGTGKEDFCLYEVRRK